MKDVVIISTKEYEMLKKYEFIISRSLDEVVAYTDKEDYVDIEIQKMFKVIFPTVYKEIAHRAVEDYKAKKTGKEGEK